MYTKEKCAIIKQAYRLSPKALYPHSIERQNVSLVLRIFDESNVAALKCHGPMGHPVKAYIGKEPLFS